jgi:hypothetical protein
LVCELGFATRNPTYEFSLFESVAQVGGCSL